MPMRSARLNGLLSGGPVDEQETRLQGTLVPSDKTRDSVAGSHKRELVGQARQKAFRSGSSFFPTRGEAALLLAVWLCQPIHPRMGRLGSKSFGHWETEADATLSDRDCQIPAGTTSDSRPLRLGVWNRIVAKECDPR